MERNMLLATDLDGTFLAGNSRSRQTLYQLIARRPDIQLAYVTGRGLERVLPLLSDPSMPQPDYIICDVGATIVSGQTQQAIQPIQSEVAARWPGEKSVESCFARFDRLTRQETPQERRVSFFCEAAAVTPEVERAAAELNCDLLFSGGMYLDILPKGVNKGATLRRLVEHLGLGPEAVLVAGDTLNDLSMFEQGFKGVCVGASEAELLDATRALPSVLHAARPGCEGILEAFGHFDILDRGAIAELQAAERPAGRSALLVVYHRLPYDEVVENGERLRRRPRSPNGIIPTLLSFFADDKERGARDGTWLAWAVHDPADGPLEDARTPVDVENYPNLTTLRIPLTQEQVDIFYKTFSKEAFWPLLHTYWERARFREDHWQVFREVNRAFAEAAAAEAAPGALVWLHDNNLGMVPAMLREKRPDVRIAFFHHTYFPSADIFNVVPWRREIIGSLLQCDFIAFHIPRQVENFVDVARGVAPLRVTRRVACAPRFLSYGCAVGLDEMSEEIEVHGRRILLGAHPVGLDVRRVEQTLKLPRIEERISRFRQDLRGQQLILSVERLDYTKGTLEKLLAYEQLLEQRPELSGRVRLICVCVPAAGEMTVYDELQTQIERAVGRINGRFSRLGWTPVEYFFRSLPFEEVVAYYACAHVMWTTPLRDGLNLVAKEFVATQGLIDRHGVLVLSEFAGAAAELKGALLTNPHDRADMVATIQRGITMSAEEARDRMRQMFDIVKHNDNRHWGESLLAAAESTASPVAVAEGVPAPTRTPRRSRRRLG
jgi:glucosylglycerol-phosphate synthase